VWVCLDLSVRVYSRAPSRPLHMKLIVSISSKEEGKVHLKIAIDQSVVCQHVFSQRAVYSLA
jgi:hypothetical protein